VTRATPALLAAVLAACGATPPNAFEEGFRVPALTAAERETMHDLLHGIDAPAPRSDWRRGDAVLLGVRVDRGSGPELLALRFQLRSVPPAGRPAAATHDGSNGVAPPRVELAALVREAGREPTELTLEVPHETLTVSIPAGMRLVEAARVARAAGQPPPPDLAASLQPVGLAIYTFFDIGRHQPELWRIIVDVSDRPSLFSVLTHFGVSVSLRIDLEASQLVERVPGFPLAVPGCRVPIVVLANGQPALYVNVYAVEPDPPFHVVGGIVAVEAHRPSDPQVTLRIDLLAARRGGINAAR
jgi:hypothetical protein